MTFLSHSGGGSDKDEEEKEEDGVVAVGLFFMIMPVSSFRFSSLVGFSGWSLILPVVRCRQFPSVVIYRTRLQDISRVVGQFPYKLKKRKSAFSCSYRVILRADHFLTSKLDFDPTTCYVTTVLRRNPKRVEEATNSRFDFLFIFLLIPTSTQTMMNSQGTS